MKVRKMEDLFNKYLSEVLMVKYPKDSIQMKIICQTVKFMRYNQYNPPK